MDGGALLCFLLCSGREQFRRGAFRRVVTGFDIIGQCFGVCSFMEWEISQGHILNN